MAERIQRRVTNQYRVTMPGSRWKDIGGMRFGMLTAIEPTGEKRHGAHLWLCRCDCGTEKAIPVCSLNPNKHVKSCGCLLYDGSRQRTHGMSRTKIFKRWETMLRRCNEITHPCYKYYGAKGILVCERWHSFTSFYEDMGDVPFPDATIDRIDPDGNYEPENCRWLSRSENSKRARKGKRGRPRKTPVGSAPPPEA